MNQKKVLVCGAGGFIGSHLTKKLKEDNCWVRAVDLKYPEFSKSTADQFLIGDLRNFDFCSEVLNEYFDEIYQLAADMGGAGYIFSGDNDADIMHNSAQINLNILKLSTNLKPGKIFYSSSACIYPEYNQTSNIAPNCSESSAYPAAPDSEYGWEKLFSERLFLAYKRNYNLNIKIARFHNIFGPEGTWRGGKEKAPAALCRKIAEANDGEEIEVWGDGNQTRSFLFIDECIEGVLRLMNSEFTGPFNIGSEEMISINNLAKMIINISGKKIQLKHIDGPLGVRGRNSDNSLIKEKLNWEPKEPLQKGIEVTYKWVENEVKKKNKEQIETLSEEK